MQKWENDIRECNQIDWDDIHRAGAENINANAWGSGEDNPRSFLTSKQVKEIRRLAYSGECEDLKVLGEMFNVSPYTIRPVIFGTTWKHLPFDPNYKAPDVRKIKDKDILSIRARWANRKSVPIQQKQMAVEYGVTPTCISGIILRKVAKHI